MVLEARKAGLAGATVLKGIIGFGRSSRIHTSKIVDEEKKIDDFVVAQNKYNICQQTFKAVDNKILLIWLNQHLHQTPVNGYRIR
ncbi:MAG: DUF190 domain-containing protein [Bacteroidetes bacterium]|nr:DUF190 domain-containing protein [Bacteroidota bacterium]MBU1423516.1 DUF190 domain-containing protein [Bacteroidota bacterium]MBU2636246.1 DUF190 domain-containing protein [Bacteroidota bacterium]